MTAAFVYIIIFALLMFLMHRGHGGMGGCGSHSRYQHSNKKSEGTGDQSQQNHSRHSPGVIESESQSRKQQQDFPRALLIALAYILPFFLFFVLVLGDVAISPSFLLLFLAIYFLAMSYSMGGVSVHEDVGEKE
ncbi:MAG: hypothetical protein L0Y56_12875, partial [Nitrospira sp.]|nr:hypothetical protein [Nitrospira sp.]